MLAKQYRIGSRKRIEHILKKGRSFRFRCFFFRLLQNRNTFHRFAVVMPKKITKTGVARNTLRRRIYEAVRLNLPTKREKCYDVVILGTSRAANLSYRNISNDLRAALSNL